ncbi:MAG: acyl-CoA dehydrogenase family protein [Bryobacteraceae bacterium]|nr:acyl-CoA dehydrogenase family protein [Bryobacteraceae bacterium]
MPIHDLTSPGQAAPLLVWNEEEGMFRDAVAEFARKEIAPRVRAMDEAGRLDPALLRQLFEMGLMGIEIPEELGGQGGTFTQALIAIEELAKIDPSVAVVVDVQNTLVNNAIRRWGTAEQQRRWLPRLATDTLGAFALSEAGAGSDAFALAARAVRDGGEYVLNGRKLWITNAAEAGLFLVFANSNPDAGHRGITCFVVERGAKGLGVGRKEDKLGIRASSTCELILDEVRVPAADVLGEPGMGYRIAIETLNEGRIGIGAQMTGLAAAALEHAAGYANQRTQFGQPIAAFQAVRMELAKMATDIESARLLVYNAARRRECGLDFVKEAAMAKYWSSEIAETVASRAVEIFGGAGFTRDYPVEKLYRDAKIGRIYEGTTNMQLLTIARQLLG